VEAKQFRLLSCWHALNLVDVGVEWVVTRRKDIRKRLVFSQVRVTLFQHFLLHEVFKQGRQDAIILEAGNSTTVVAFTDQVLERFEWDILVIINKMRKLAHRDLQVGHCEVVLDVESE